MECYPIQEQPAIFPNVRRLMQMTDVSSFNLPEEVRLSHAPTQEFH